MFNTVPTLAQKAGDRKIHWRAVAVLPGLNSITPSPGLAGPVTGITGNKLVVAGGANFPGGMPWLGGSKVYYNDVYILQRAKGNKFSWLDVKPLSLKQKLAYSGNVTTPGGIVCVGGETDTGHTRKSFVLQWDESLQDVRFRDLPDLPFAIANMAIANIGNTIYIAGGEDGRNVFNTFLALDISMASPQWKRLPDLPIAMSHSAAVAQTNGKNQCIYVFGGRAKSHDDLSKLYNVVFRFDPAENKWEQISSISDGSTTTNLSAATAIAYGDACILLIGGDKGTIFHQVESFNLAMAAATSSAEKDRLQADKIKLLDAHPGFSRDVLAYNTIGDCWVKIGELPGWGPVTTTAVEWNGNIFIPSGEIKPGRRTPDIVMGIEGK